MLIVDDVPITTESVLARGGSVHGTFARQQAALLHGRRLPARFVQINCASCPHKHASGHSYFLHALIESSDLVVCSALGVDMYDCVYPCRTARFGTSIWSHHLVRANYSFLCEWMCRYGLGAGGTASSEEQ